MMLLLKIAWRNIFRHKAKSLVVGSILFLGTFIMTLGNGVISGMDKGLQENIVERFTGDLVLISTNQLDDGVLFSMMGKPVEPFYNYTNIKVFLKNDPIVRDFIPVGKGAVSIINETGDMSYGNFIGVDFDAYQKMFHSNVVILEGRDYTNHERAVLMSKETRKRYIEYNNYWLNPAGYPLVLSNYIDDISNIAQADELMVAMKTNIKLPVLVKNDIDFALANTNSLNIRSNLVLMGFSDQGTGDIRANVNGIIKYQFLNNIWGSFNIVDIESYRESYSYRSAADKVVISKEKEKLLSVDSGNIEDLFAGGDIFATGETGQANYQELKIKTAPKTNLQTVNIEEGAYNLVFVKLKPGIGMDKGVKLLNQSLSNSQLGMRAVTWKKAAGMIANMATIIRTVLYGFVLVLFIVAVFIIMNTLSMAAMERISEIGMMRAVGAQKNFISRMFMSETFILSFFFGGLGIIAGVILVNITAMMNLTSTNDFLQLLYGGDTFRPILSLMDIVFCIFMLLLVTGLSVIYPLFVARRITPLDAITKE